MTKSYLKRLRVYDYVALAVAAIFIVALGYYSYAGGGDTLVVEIRSREGRAAYSLSENRELVIQGPLGETVVSIREKTVRVISDPGPLQICVNAGSIASQGQWLACLPNQVLISIQGKNSDEVDIISQ